jgi:hypothetical protein
LPPWFRSCDCARDSASFQSEFAKVATQRIGVTDEVEVWRSRLSPPTVSNWAPFTIEHPQVLDEWCEPKAIASGCDDCVGSQAGAVLQHDLAAVEAVNGRNDCDLAVTDVADEITGVADRYDVSCRELP